VFQPSLLFITEANADWNHEKPLRAALNRTFVC